MRARQGKSGARLQRMSNWAPPVFAIVVGFYEPNKEIAQTLLFSVVMLVKLRKTWLNPSHSDKAPLPLALFSGHFV
jgi:hypothetical protein